MFTRQYGNQHFKKCNEWLAERYGDDEIIDWALTSKSKTSAPLATIQSPALTDTSKKSAAKESDAGFPEEEIDQATEPAKSTDTADEFEDDLDALEALVATETAR